MKDTVSELGDRLGMGCYQQQHTADEVYAHVMWLEERARAEGRKESELKGAEASVVLRLLLDRMTKLANVSGSDIAQELLTLANAYQVLNSCR